MDMICQMALKDWRSLNSFSAVLTEQQAKQMLDYEVENGKRTTFVVRLHQKLTSMRSIRERKELLERCME